jgi:hypothetical protein
MEVKKAILGEVSLSYNNTAKRLTITHIQKAA